jgi:hypothetical protein
MGMFDYIKCDYPLPGEKIEFVDEFQTKDFDCTLATILITEIGRIVISKNPENRTESVLDHYTGTIEFYGSNIVASGPSGQYTSNGEDSESVCFEATFVDGQLTDIKQTGYERQPVLASKEMPKLGSYKKGSELNEEDSYLGQTLFVCWGGFGSVDERGYEAEVVYETDEQLCVKKGEGTRNRPGELELIYRSQIGSTLFKDKEEAQADYDYRTEQMAKAKENYARKLKEREEN